MGSKTGNHKLCNIGDISRKTLSVDPYRSWQPQWSVHLTENEFHPTHSYITCLQGQQTFTNFI